MKGNCSIHLDQMKGIFHNPTLTERERGLSLSLSNMALYFCIVSVCKKNQIKYRVVGDGFFQERNTVV